MFYPLGSRFHAHEEERFVLLPSGDLKVNICGGNFGARPRKPEIKTPASIKRLQDVTHLSTKDGPL